MTDLGNRAATDALFAALYPDLRRFASAISSADIDPDDLVQEALARTLARHDLTALADPARYLRVALFRLAANERRRLGRFRSAVERLGRAEVLLPSYPSDLDDLRHLSPSDRALVFLTVVEGVAIGDAADLLGMSAVAARMRKHRALQRLGRAVRKDQADG